MAELDILHVVRSGAEPFCLLHYLVGRDEDELRVLVDEFSDQPGAGDPIDLDPFACDPFHRTPPCCGLCGEASTSLASPGDLLCTVTNGPEHLIALRAWRPTEEGLAEKRVHVFPHDLACLGHLEEAAE